jgi:hypothetical protein
MTTCCASSSIPPRSPPPGQTAEDGACPPHHERVRTGQPYHEADFAGDLEHVSRLALEGMPRMSRNIVYQSFLTTGHGSRFREQCVSTRLRCATSPSDTTGGLLDRGSICVSWAHKCASDRGRVESRRQKNRPRFLSQLRFNVIRFDLSFAHHLKHHHPAREWRRPSRVAFSGTIGSVRQRCMGVSRYLNSRCRYGLTSTPFTSAKILPGPSSTNPSSTWPPASKQSGFVNVRWRVSFGCT